MDTVKLSKTIRQRVYETDETPPVVGTRAKRLFDIEPDIKGFHYDRKRWVDEEDDKTRNPGYIGALTDQTTEGLVKTYWKSGIGSGNDCDVVSLIRNSYDSDWLWSPVIHNGMYYSHYHEYFLWGDASETYPLISNFTDVFNPEEDYITLQNVPKEGSPIYATIFRRESDYSALPYRHARSVGAFTGQISSPGTRYTPHDSNDYPIWSQVDSFNRYECFYHTVSGRLYINQNFAFKVCPFTGEQVEAEGVSFAAEWMETYDAIGLKNQHVYLNYFPISPPTSVSYGYNHYLYVMLWPDNGPLERWTLADNNELFFHDATDKVYCVDYDLGIIRFGGHKASDTFLYEAITDTTHQISIINGEDYPRQGVITLASGEQVAYYGIDDNSPTHHTLTQCIRGYGGTAASAQGINTSVTHVQQGMAPPDGWNIGVAYETTPRIEYEPRYSSDLLIADSVDVRPTSNEKANGIIHISRKPTQLTEILLEVDKNKIGNALYGPVYLTNDYALLTATAYDHEEDPVPGLLLTIEETNSPFVGLLNGVQAPYTAKTVQSGQIKTSFTPGSLEDSFGAKVSSVSFSGLNTLITIPGDYRNVDLADVFIFGITKDDPMIGTVGLQSDTTAFANTSTYPQAQASLTLSTITGYAVNVNDVYSENYFNNGTVTITTTGGQTYLRTIVYYKNGILYLNESVPIVFADIDTVYIMHEDWQEWNPNDLNGRKKIIYEWDTSAIHPITGNLGAYFPITPSSVSYSGGYSTFTFNYTLPVPNKDDDTNNLGGYWLTTPTVVTFRAYGNDPLTNNLIYSNEVSVRIELPDYLKGVEDAVNGRIPYGMRCSYTTSGYTATGYGGSTFLSINAQAKSPNPWASLVHLVNL